LSFWNFTRRDFALQQCSLTFAGFCPGVDKKSLPRERAYGLPLAVALPTPALFGLTL
jgi:hypothetical protein